MSYFQRPFAEAGDKTSVPVNAPLDGTVSFESGYGVDYELDQDNPQKKNIERRKLNDILYNITAQLRQWQDSLFPAFVSASENNGTPVSYSLDAGVVGSGYDGVGVYFSTVDSNTNPLSDSSSWRKWNPFPALFVTGMVMPFDGLTAPDGWLMRNGLTIGSADSGAEARANADCEALFKQLWSTYPQSVLAIQDSTGAASTRGASADDDWAANKRLPLPDTRGRIIAGHNSMGATNSGRLTNSRPGGVNGNQLGATGGESAHLQDVLEVAPHGHTIQASDRTGGGTPGAIMGPRTLSPRNIVLPSAAEDQLPFNVCQPTQVGNYIIKL